MADRISKPLKRAARFPPDSAARSRPDHEKARTGESGHAQTAGLHALQRLADDSPVVSRLAALTAAGRGPLQRAIDVEAETRDGSVVISASGVRDDFKKGDDAGDEGWNGVDKYKADTSVEDVGTLSFGPVNNDFTVGQAGHVLAKQNGGVGSDPENVFAQDGGVNNGPYRRDLENKFRGDLDNAAENAEVEFRAVLYGFEDDNGNKVTPTNETLERGESDMERSSEDTDFEGFE